MKKLFTCRRSTIAMLAIICLTWLGLSRGIDVSLAIAGVVASIAGANSYENSNIIKQTGKVDNAG